MSPLLDKTSMNPSRALRKNSSKSADDSDFGIGVGAKSKNIKIRQYKNSRNETYILNLKEFCKKICKRYFAPNFLFVLAELILQNSIFEYRTPSLNKSESFFNPELS